MGIFALLVIGKKLVYEAFSRAIDDYGAILYGSEYWTAKVQHIHKMSAEMDANTNARSYKIKQDKNDHIRYKVQVSTYWG